MPSPGTILIGGSGRCGTTLLRDVVLSHPRVWGVPKESHLFAPPDPNLVSLYLRARDGTLTEAYLRRVRAQLISYFAKGYAHHIIARVGRQRYELAFQRFFDVARGWVGKPSPEARKVIARWARGLSWPGRSPGATHWCEKSPHNVLHFPELAELYPGARLLHIVRDPRDTIDSLAQQEWTRTGGYRGVGSCILWYEKWLDGYEDALRRGMRGLGGYYELRYEALVRYPKQWAKLWAHLGLKPPARPALRPVHEGRYKKWTAPQSRAFREMQRRRPRVEQWVAETQQIIGRK